MKDLNWIRQNDIAHRGYYTKDQTIPENSISAFQHAILYGYSIELDVNVTKDGVVVAFHDHNLERVFNDERKLSEVNYDEIRYKTLFDTSEYIPTLKEVLNVVKGRVPLLIELKPKGDVIKLCESFFKDIHDYQGKYAIFSFHPKVVYWFKKHHPEVIRGQISEYFKHDRMNRIFKHLMKTMAFNRFTQPDFISYGIYDLPNRYVDKLMKKGMTVISYAARSQEDLDRIRARYHNAVFEHFCPEHNDKNQ